MQWCFSCSLQPHLIAVFASSYSIIVAELEAALAAARGAAAASARAADGDAKKVSHNGFRPIASYDAMHVLPSSLFHARSWLVDVFVLSLVCLLTPYVVLVKHFVRLSTIFIVFSTNLFFNWFVIRESACALLLWKKCNISRRSKNQATEWFVVEKFLEIRGLATAGQLQAAALSVRVC